MKHAIPSALMIIVAPMWRSHRLKMRLMEMSKAFPANYTESKVGTYTTLPDL